MNLLQRLRRPGRSLGRSESPGEQESSRLDWPQPAERPDPVDQSRPLYREFSRMSVARNIPLRLVRQRRSDIRGAIRALAAAARRVPASDTVAAPPASDAPKGGLPTWAMVPIDVFILVAEFGFYFVAWQLTGGALDTPLDWLTLLPQALLTPLLVLLTAWRLGPLLRSADHKRASLYDAPPVKNTAPGATDDTDEDTPPVTRPIRLSDIWYRAGPLSKFCLLLAGTATCILGGLAFFRAVALAAGGGSGLGGLAFLLSLIFVLVPAMAIAAHAQHNPDHPRDLLRVWSRRRAEKRAARHGDRWRHLLGIAQNIASESEYHHTSIDGEIADNRATVPKALGWQPPHPRPATSGEPARRGDDSVEEQLWRHIHSEHARLLDFPTAETLRTALGEVLTALAFYRPPDWRDKLGYPAEDTATAAAPTANGRVAANGHGPTPGTSALADLPDTNGTPARFPDDHPRE
ncbi:hypothetical protein [Salinactinospora qingdaonensis]|uniref:Uncharacterized protein n=1 Tax=Salinactinospora qingdaonensis TaxID=702744 RepID=A0ABP7FEW2_9ACTN